MSRNSKSKDHTKALNIPLTLTQGDMLQEAKDQTQALNIPVKVPLGGGRYAELTEWNGSKRVDLRFWKTDTIPTKTRYKQKQNETHYENISENNKLCM
jgi:hypothetical protein